MWAYVATYEMPNDDPGGARAAGAGRATRCAPTARSGSARRRRCGCSARSRRPARFRAWEKVLVWSHWLWFLFPHGTVAYLLLRRPEHFPRGAAQIYATFDLGLIGYWAIPTAPPWYAAAQGLMDDGRTPELRRMMVEYGEQFWKSGWAPLYGFLGGNPLAAMPSLHFATSVTAAHVLTDSGAAGRAARLGVRGDARHRARLPRRALRRRPRRRARAGRGRPPRHARRRGPLARGLGRRCPRRSSGGRGRERDAGPRTPAPASERPARARARGARARGGRGRGPRPRDQPPQPARRSARSWLLSIAALYFLLPQLAGLDDTWQRIEDGSPYWMIVALLFASGCSSATSRCSAGSSCAPARRGSAGGRATRSRWPGSRPRGSSPPAAPAASC